MGYGNNIQWSCKNYTKLKTCQNDSFISERNSTTYISVSYVAIKNPVSV